MFEDVFDRMLRFLNRYFCLEIAFGVFILFNFEKASVVMKISAGASRLYLPSLILPIFGWVFSGYFIKRSGRRIYNY